MPTELRYTLTNIELKYQMTEQHDLKKERPNITKGYKNFNLLFFLNKQATEDEAQRLHGEMLGTSYLKNVFHKINQLIMLTLHISKVKTLIMMITDKHCQPSKL